ncbi:hypothetical protein [Candidatus Minimicrobia vallesae]|uniref:hypothetical protein n=1 Tax=Candidatus Minimicrobia vallesae TaxID=2841264 RepID=UPI001E30DC0A|nr:hypothetical protein [Candidatus Minimicrobia vallesae]
MLANWLEKKWDLCLIADSKVETVSLYSQGDYTDLCRGGHADSTGKVGAFKLTKTAGAYWRGNENNPQMQRIYGVAFATQEELDEYLKKIGNCKTARSSQVRQGA